MNIPRFVFQFLLSGKRLRSRLIFYSHNLPSYEVKLKLCVLIELIHSASLIHDDIIDESIFRRGKATIKHLYDIPRAVSIGYFIFSKLFLNILNMNPCWQNQCYKVLSDMCLGELWEIECMNDANRSFQHYLKVIRCKTAVLFALCCGLKEPDCWMEQDSLFGTLYGISFQLFDDLQDSLFSSNQLGKPSNKDSQLGVLTMPALLKQHYNKTNRPGSTKKCIQIGIAYLEKAKMISENSFWSQEADLLIQKYHSLMI